jgi:hypothetical protein
MRHEVKPPQSSPVTAIGDFINSHINNALVVNGQLDARTNMESLPLMEPRGELLVRYEPDTKELFISAKAFKDYCVRHQINYKGILNDLTKTGVFKEAMNKRMSKGMKVVAPAVRVLRFDASAHQFLHLETEEAESENRDSVVSDQLA